MRKYFSHPIKKAITLQHFVTIETLDISSEFRYPEEAHEFYEFAYTDSGALCCILDGEPIQLLQGDFLLIPHSCRFFVNFTLFCEIHIFYLPRHFTSTAFCAWSLFSASSKISFACDSNTSAVISSSLCAGKQCKTIAFGSATFITSALI